MVGWRTVAALAPLLLTGCVDGPFERANPHDPEAEFSIQLIATRDTVTLAEPDVAILVVTTPNIGGHLALITSDYDKLVNFGDGVFRLVMASPVVAPITITARYLNKEATLTVYRAPSP
jgi:hypothetical protein